ncbi:amidohydrolase family protein [Hyphomonas sp.]|uniref:amidohydrolase family protein n=1 Tax=Hyphomonas sp. TaxID=87 RepID=UPI001BD1285E|nr:amidohydrolase family protein [Hyphomonas sp.]
MLNRFGSTALAALFMLGACAHEVEAPALDVVEAAPAPVTETWSVRLFDQTLGQLVATTEGNTIKVDYEFRNNGRGPTLAETITLGEDGLPAAWKIDGATTFGNEVHETFALEGGVASWTDTTGSASAERTEPAIYIPQNASPYTLAIYAKALLADNDMTLPAWPAGSLTMSAQDKLRVEGAGGPVAATVYALVGDDVDPTYFLTDEDGDLFALISPRFVVVREGYEEADDQLKELATRLSTERLETIQTETAHRFDAPLAIINVRIFDPKAKAMSAPSTVKVEDGVITSVTAGVADTAGAYVVDGQGGSLVPGLAEMHGHMGQDAALKNIAAGVTLVRDMGNENAVLSELIGKIEAGKLAGPRVVRSGFIEGKSPFSSNNGILVNSEEEALAAVDWYADQGDFWQVKIYNSMTPAWVPAVVERAKERGLKVSGHVPAFTNADAMIEAGYDEMTHINQLMLGWVLAPEEDTRTLLRLTALQRLPMVDLDGAEVIRTLDLMAENGVAIDPTYAIHEALLLSRNGQVQAGMADYVDHMPIAVQREAKAAWSAIGSPEEDAAYKGAFDQITGTIRRMKDRGIFIVMGTDLGGALTLHRELELYQKAGFTPEEILARATFEAADYMGLGDELGSIEPGKKADFFLVPGNPVEDLKAIKTIRLVSKGDTLYFPSEIYPYFGIRPFTDIPAVTAPSAQD